MSRQQKANWSVSTGTSKTGDTSVSTKTYPLVQGMREAGLACKWTGTTTGEITVYISYDHKILDQGTDPWNGTWDPVDAELSTPPTNPTGAPGQFSISMEPFRAAFVYVDFARSAGSGTIEATLTTAWPP